jgi:hypothetical protein
LSKVEYLWNEDSKYYTVVLEDGSSVKIAAPFLASKKATDSYIVKLWLLERARESIPPRRTGSFTE